MEVTKGVIKSKKCFESAKEKNSETLWIPQVINGGCEVTENTFDNFTTKQKNNKGRRLANSFALL
jgi:hypothetical protein